MRTLSAFGAFLYNDSDDFYDFADFLNFIFNCLNQD